ncbi:structural maintenance of chromosome 2, putative [Perkinsus marinus ATCC 50983]|uniref:Structural maintenance of chromosome 2, putative n=1 Tax=Perkinsus marinus (strain ATCC 50983 / TXsc) TaxID=423536 RepID=C5KXF8_PERM5|nr:structural maintenance of chromosome 2, putative [Perkinsus marinus ATCC 50983]EER10682.1 structural maintenance of chromosome 2, putative [Perkinsus marinus ATCC 50983]|eukprot:XP_002778887.1 structural maintenance of chromosome 2, putative [Perkinsus marinus ATCC 50983]
MGDSSTVSTAGFGPLWATIGAANQVNQHIGCTARTVKLVSRKQIFLILPDQDASAGLEGGKAVRIFPCSMNPLDSLRQWHDEGEVPENAVALSWATLLGKMKSRKGRVKVEAKVIGEDDRNAWWIMSVNKFEPGTVSFCCMEEEYRSYYIRHNNDKIDACIEEVGSGGFKQAASFNLLLRSDCDPRVNRNGSSVLNLSVDRSILEDSQGPDKTVESPSGSTVEAEQESSIGGLLESGIVDDSPLRSRVGEIEEEEDGGGGGRDDDTDVSTRSQKRTRDVRSVPKKTRGKVGNGEESTPEAKPSDPKRKRHDSLSGAMAVLVVSGKVDRRGGADRGDGNRLSTDSVFGHEERPLARPSEARDSVFDLTIDHDEAPDVSRIDPAPTSAVFEELEEVRRALSIALDRDLESQEEIKLLRKQLESARKSSKESRELKQLRKEFEKAKQGFERSEAEAREKIRTLKQELVLELEAKDEALNRTEALEEKLEEKQASEEEATCTIKSLKKELKQKTERLRALQQKPDDVATTGDDERVAGLEQELEEAQRLQAESQDVIKALRTELEDGEDRMKKLREELEEAKEAATEGTGTLRDDLEAAEEARSESQAAVVALEAELAEVKAKVIELQEEQEAADARWQEVQSEKQAREGEINELKRTLESLERLPLELETTKTERNKAQIAMFGLEAEIEALKERLEGKEREMKTMMAESVNGKEEGTSLRGSNVGKPPLAAAGTEKPAVSSNRRESREARSRLSLEMDEAVAGLLGFGGDLAAVPEGCPIAGDQSVDKYKQIIVELQEKVKKQDGWLDECEFDISKWEGRYRHEQEEHERTLRKYKEAKEALEKAEKERTELRAEAQRLSLQLERVSEEREAVEKAMKELEAAGEGGLGDESVVTLAPLVAVNNVKPESRTTSTSTSMSMRSLMSYEQRFEALKVETAKLKQEAEAFEGSKRVVETRAENAEKKVEFLKAQRNEFEDTLEKLMKQMDVISAERTRLLHELSLAQDELKALKTGIAGVSDYNTAIKEAMRDAQRSARSVHDRGGEGREDTPPECEKTKVGEFAVTGVTQEGREEEGPVRVAEKSSPQAPLQAAEVLQRSSPVIDTVRSAKGKPPGGDGALSPLSVRMSELGPIQNSTEEEQEDKENVAIETIVEEAAETEDVAKERSPLKPSNSQPKITPLNPGVTPSKIGKPRNPGVIPGATPLTMSKPHRVRQLAEAFTASACAAAQSPKKPVELFVKPRIKNPISFRALGRLDGKPNDH